MNFSRMQHRSKAYFANNVMISCLFFILFVKTSLASRLEGIMNEEDENKLRQNGMDSFSILVLVFFSLLVLQLYAKTFCSLNPLLMTVEVVVILVSLD